jgi:SNF2 family DNA or RNA helicase
MDFDIVLTTYSTLVGDFSKDPGVLHQVQWFRVVLDEGMTLRGMGSLSTSLLELTSNGG